MQSRRAFQWLFVPASAMALAAGFWVPVAADQPESPVACRVTGRATSAGLALPGVSVVARIGDVLKAATSTEPDGAYTLSLPAGAYHLSADLTGFTRVDRDVSIDQSACDQKIDLQFALTPRSAPTQQAQTQPRNQSMTGRAGGRGAASPSARFQQLNVAAQASAEAALEADVPAEAAEAARTLLPPGFSTTDSADAVTINGNAASLDRGMLADRLEAIGRGEFDPATGTFAGGFGPGAGPAGADGGPGGFAGRGGPGGPGPGGDRGGGPGGGGFFLGGRGGRQNLYSATANYTFGGSPLDATRYQLEPGTPVAKPGYTHQTFGFTAGGPVKIPGVYDGTRRTTFNVNYGGNRGSNLFDQYATVPTDAMSAGDFSALPVTLIDPLTGQPYPGNRIPADRMSPSALALLAFLPPANLSGTSRNFHELTPVQSSADTINGRLTDTCTAPPPAS